MTGNLQDFYAELRTEMDIVHVQLATDQDVRPAVTRLTGVVERMLGSMYEHDVAGLLPGESNPFRGGSSGGSADRG